LQNFQFACGRAYFVYALPVNSFLLSVYLLFTITVNNLCGIMSFLLVKGYAMLEISVFPQNKAATHDI
jgi:hypothetical protein